MYGPRPICFSAHWCADYSKYRGFMAGGISTASSLLPFLDHGSAGKTFMSHSHSTASYAGYIQAPLKWGEDKTWTRGPWTPTLAGPGPWTTFMDRIHGPPVMDWVHGHFF